MPLLPTPSIEDLEDHFFGSGAFTFGWFDTDSVHFPATVNHYEPDSNYYNVIESKLITADMFNEGIKAFAGILPDRTYQDLIEDMDAVDVDAIIQLIFWNEIRLS
jgi:hypothetical protein